MLSINYGNFLRRNETEKARYEFNRPVIALAVNTFCVFCVTGACVMGALFAYSSLVKPTPTFSQDTFTKAQTLNNNLSKGIAVMKQARPENINTVSIISQITSHKPSDVAIKDIKITPGHYTIKGLTYSQESANTYASSLEFGKDFQTAVTSVSFDKGIYTFTIEANTMKKASTKTTAPAKSQVQAKGDTKNV